MHDFMKLILSELRGAVGIAAVSVVICVIAICAAAFVYNSRHADGKRFPLARALAVTALVGWAAAILYLTVFRTYGGGGANFHLFRAWREAWNNFSFQNWSNVLLNVAMFAPLGLLLPFVWGGFRNPLAALAAALAPTVIIEILQLTMGVGMFDVDDIFANFTGAIVCYCAVMAIISAVGDAVGGAVGGASGGDKKRVARAVAYASVPAAAALILAGTFIYYYAKPYGNLSLAPSFRTRTENVVWSVNFDVSDDTENIRIYRAASLDNDGCRAEAEKFFASFGVAADELDVAVYDDGVYASDHRYASVYVYRADGSRSIDFFRGEQCPAPDRETVEARLSEIGIDVPDGADFRVVSEHACMFTLERSGDGGVAGWIRVTFARGNGGEPLLKTVSDHMTECEYAADETVISQSDALARMRAGDFDGDLFEYLAPSKVEVLGCELSYEADTKGFYQPVWDFTVRCDKSEEEFTIRIPALG